MGNSQSPEDIFDEMVKVLERLPALTDNANRSLVIEKIPEDLRGRFNGIERTNVIANEFAKLFRDYDQHTEQLLKAINRVEKHSNNYIALKELIWSEKISKKILGEKWEVITQLISILEKSDVDRGRNCYREILSVYRSSSESSREVNTYSWKLMVLEVIYEYSHDMRDIDAANQWPQLLRFMWDVIKGFENSIVQEVNQILQKILDNTKIESYYNQYKSSYNNQYKSPKAEIWPKSYLVVNIRNSNTNDKYFVGFYHLDKSPDGACKTTPLSNNSISVNKNELENDIGRELSQCLLNQLKNPPDLIEFFIPSKLSLHELKFDELQIIDEDEDENDFTTTFGEKYPVTIRPQIPPRLNLKHNIKSSKEKRWDKNQTVLKPISFEKALEPEKLHDELQGTHENEYFVEIVFPVTDLRTIRAAIVTGVPIVLWFRNASPCENLTSIQKQLEEEQSNNGSDSLPQIIRRIRAKNKSSDVKISLLWDDPYSDPSEHLEKFSAEYPTTQES